MGLMEYANRVVLFFIITGIGLTILNFNDANKYVLHDGCIHLKRVYFTGFAFETYYTPITCDKTKFKSYLKRNEGKSEQSTTRN